MITLVSKVQTVLRNDSPSLLVLGNVIAAALALISSPIVARSIGPTGRGETAAAIALFFLVPIILALGVPLEVRRRAATSDGKGVLRSARMLAAVSTLAALVLAAAAYLTIFSGFEMPARWVASAGIALAPISISWMCDVSVLIAHQRYRSIFLMKVVQPVVYVVFILAFWAAGAATVATVLTASVSGLFATFLVGLMLTRTSALGERDPVRHLWRSSVQFSGSAIAEAASSKLDQVIALPLIGAFQAGIYSVAVTVALVPAALGQALGAAFFAPIAKANGPERQVRQAQAVRSALALAIWTCPPAALVAIVGIPIVFGSEFQASVGVACISIVGSGLTIGAFVTSMSLAADGRGARMTIAQVASLAVAVVSLLILGPPLGAIGAAIASTIGYLVLLILLLVALQLPVSHVLPGRADFKETLRHLFRDKVSEV